MNNDRWLFEPQQRRMRQRARKATMPCFNSRAPCRDALLSVPEKKQTGFTLIEVLIALMIIAIALSAAVRATNESIRSTQHVRDLAVAHWVGMNVISEIQTNMLSLSESNNPIHGKMNMLGQNWNWSATIQSKNKFNQERIAVKVDLKNKNITTLFFDKNIIL